MISSKRRTWGRYERVLTTHYDYIAFSRIIGNRLRGPVQWTACFLLVSSGHTVVKTYAETSLHQEEICDGEFYSRRLRYDPERKELSVSLLSLHRS